MKTSVMEKEKLERFGSSLFRKELKKK